MDAKNINKYAGRKFLPPARLISPVLVMMSCQRRIRSSLSSESGKFIPKH
jgi:hypothetical protein